MELFGKVIDLYRTKYPDLPSRLPIKPGNYFAINISNGKQEDRIKVANINAMVTPSLPNGVYQYAFRVFNEDDMIGGAISWLFQLYESSREEEF